MSPYKTALAAPLAATLLAVTAAFATPAAAHTTPWRSAWGASPQVATHTDWYPNWSEAGFSNQSVRQVIRAYAEGSELRVRLTNAYGKTPCGSPGPASPAAPGAPPSCPARCARCASGEPGR